MSPGTLLFDCSLCSRSSLEWTQRGVDAVFGNGSKVAAAGVGGGLRSRATMVWKSRSMMNSGLVDGAFVRENGLAELSPVVGSGELGVGSRMSWVSALLSANETS